MKESPHSLCEGLPVSVKAQLTLSNIICAGTDAQEGL